MALGIDTEEVDLPEASTLLDLLRQLRQQHPDALSQYALNAQDALQPSVLLCVGDQHVGDDLLKPLHDGEEVTILSVISGG